MTDIKQEEIKVPEYFDMGDCELKKISHDAIKERVDLIKKDCDYLVEWLPWPSKKISVQDDKEYIDGCLEDWDNGDAYLYAVFDKRNNSSAFLGQVEIIVRSKRLKIFELGYWLGEKAQGRGIVTRAIKHLDYFLLNEFSANRVYIESDVWNTKSTKVALNAGYLFESMTYCDDTMGSQRTYTFVKVKDKDAERDLRSKQKALKEIHKLIL